MCKNSPSLQHTYKYIVFMNTNMKSKISNTQECKKSELKCMGESNVETSFYFNFTKIILHHLSFFFFFFLTTTTKKKNSKCNCTVITVALCDCAAVSYKEWQNKHQEFCFLIKTNTQLAHVQKLSGDHLMQNCCASHLVVNFRSIFYVKLCVQFKTCFLFPSSSVGELQYCGWKKDALSIPQAAVFSGISEVNQGQYLLKHLGILQDKKQCRLSYVRILQYV